MGHTTTALLALALAGLPMAAPVAAAENLVRNGSFETGDFSEWGIGNRFYYVDSASYGGNAPTDGRFHAIFEEPDESLDLLQSIPTVAGREYILSFDMAQWYGYSTYYEITWDRVPAIYTYERVPEFNYTRFSTRVRAYDDSTDLEFYLYNREGFWLIDNVSVVAVTEGVPEPTTWARMIAGFGLVGAMTRRRRHLQASTAAPIHS